MDDLVVYHNPRCGSSRTALELLAARGVDVEVVEYLKQPLDAEALGMVLDLLDDPPGALVRHDKRFGELGLDPSGYTRRDEVIALLVEHPELMQRPLLVGGGRAVIARPPADTIEAFLG